MNLLRGRAARAAALMAAALLAACDGPNPWNPVGTVGGGGGGAARADSTAPTVRIIRPDSLTRNVAVGDSVFVRVRVTDNTALATVTLEGYAMRGNPALGTATRVDRFVTKTVDLTGLGRAVADTTLDRFLNATADTLSESGVLIVVTARDTAGNPASDTVLVNLGGPRISLEPSKTEYFAGTQLTLQVTASDPRDLLSSLVVAGTGAFAFERRIQFASARASIDTSLVIPIPLEARNELRVTASTTSGSSLVGTAAPVAVVIREPELDRTPPKATFQLQVPARAEQTDSFTVQVTGVDETRVDSVGVTVLGIRSSGVSRDTVRVYVGRGAVTSATFRFGLADLGLNPYEAAQVDLEVTAWARDAQGNCGAATRENTPQDLPCATVGGVRLATTSGRLVQVFLARGLTIARPNPGDVIADLAADSSYLYLSNFTRNRVELLPLGATAYGIPVRVGSNPWGLALGRFRDSLYVANSGGTNVSVIPLGGPVLNEAEHRRIFPRNERLFSVEFGATGVNSVTMHDYSDRPQFLAQASNGLLVYSTRPTAAAEDGTVRIYDATKLRSEIFIGYVDRHTSGKGIVVNADSAFHVPAPYNLVMVCPRRRYGDTSDPPCITGDAIPVSDSLTKLRALPPNAAGGRWDTRLDLGADIEEVGLSDTTFVAASTDRRFIAVGEGVRANARIPMFEADGDSLLLRGDVRDLISNTAERVIGLGINRDGSLGVARGNQAYFFNSTLRLQGVVESGAPTGGVAVHPDNQGYPGGTRRVAFVSGIESGQPYVDVIDTFNFFRIKRIFIRDPVVGALVVAPRAPGDPTAVNLRLYALTSAGVLSLPISNADLP